jgi:N-acetylglucosamine-6-phosphate deacetylase
MVFDAPGFIDVQVNGYKGTDFSSLGLTAATCTIACRDYLAESGCVGFCPTVITSTMEVYEHVLPLLVQVLCLPEFEDSLLGLHLEGPFISKEPGACGAHKGECIRDPCEPGSDTLDD